EARAVGRFILLYDSQHSGVWDGNFRIITYIRTSVESDLGEDPLLTEVAWTWILESLDEASATYRQPGGTATRVLSKGFGMLKQQSETTDLELRASWTPAGDNLNRHLTAWTDMVCTFAGLPPVSECVIQLNPIRRQSRFLARISPQMGLKILQITSTRAINLKTVTTSRPSLNSQSVGFPQSLILKPSSSTLRKNFVPAPGP